ncbi:ABC transporter substrate-binding protein [Verticiella sediminum]|uniref:Thiamine pyrimidine synthase n=1 Tax=Verticiella sediminum TaxID=1247510 RepID=A0A556AMW7_9BURK|nr:ABC transporter substrate-binding protein [Verticiella sediminum]TSH94217.1 ABC transporter substrate-binding protein [Verticiella sediminum]
MKSFVKALAAAPLALALALSTGAVQAQDLQKVRIGYPPAWSAVEAAIPYGDTLGFFKEEGIALDYVSVQGTAVLIPQVANGSVEFGIMNPDLAIIAASKGEPFPIKFFYNFYPRNIFEFTVLEDSPIKTLADLKGKKLGVGALSWGNLPMSRLMLQTADVTWMKDVQVLPVGVGPAAWERMKSGSVDALNLPATQNVMMEQAGTPIRRLEIPEEFRRIFSNGIATSDALIQKNPKLVEGMSRAVTKSLVACMADTEACVRAYWQIDPSSKPTPENEAQWVKTFVAVNEGTYKIGEVASLDGKHGAYTEEDWKNIVAKMQEGEQIATTDFDVATLYTDQFVQAANDFDADAVRAAAKAAQ